MRADLAPADGVRVPWRLTLASGWCLASAAMLPGTLWGGARAASLLALALAMPWWAAAVRVIRSDLDSFTIPDGATAAIAALGLVFAAAAPWLSGAGAGEVLEAAQGAVATGCVAFAAFWLVAAGFRRWGRDALGHGDVKLAGACAVWLAPEEAAAALEIAALAALAVLVLARREGRLRDTAVPFGAFLAPAAWLVFVLSRPLRGAGLLPW